MSSLRGFSGKRGGGLEEVYRMNPKTIISPKADNWFVNKVLKDI